jgi:predicted type IV restriction endonuclease
MLRRSGCLLIYITLDCNLFSSKYLVAQISWRRKLMASFPKKFSDRISSKLKTFQVISAAQRARDVSEADTVTVVKDMLAELFGYDKYAELTSEQQIKGTYCDLAVKLDGKIRYLIEVKSAGLELKENHLVQAINYGANQGIEWVILTNSVEWKVYRIIFGQPVAHEEVVSFSIANINANREEDLESLFILAREGISADAISSFHQRSQLLNRFTISQTVLSDTVVNCIRREMRRMFPDLKVEQEQISLILESEVLKREVLDGDKAKEAINRIKKATNKLNKAAAKTSAISEKLQSTDN